MFDKQSGFDVPSNSLTNNDCVFSEHLICNLQRFTGAQCGMYKMVLGELSRGKKQSDWVPFIFPHIYGFEHGERSRYFGLRGVKEAYRFLAHPVLGTRLMECTRIINSVDGKLIEEILGYHDVSRFHSSMTVFASFSDFSSVFTKALIKFFNAERNEKTLELLKVQVRPH